MSDKRKQDEKGKKKEKRPFDETTLGRPQTPPPQPKDYEEIEY